MGSVIYTKGEGRSTHPGKTDVAKRALPSPTLAIALKERRMRLAEKLRVPHNELTGPAFPNTLGELRDRHNT